jgi:hypothetical protein
MLSALLALLIALTGGGPPVRPADVSGGGPTAVGRVSAGAPAAATNRRAPADVSGGGPTFAADGES